MTGEEAILEGKQPTQGTQWRATHRAQPYVCIVTSNSGLAILLKLFPRPLLRRKPF